MNPDQDLSHKLKELLILKGMTAYKLSQQTGLSRDYLSKLLSGQISNPGLDKIQKIATTLNVELETFHLEPMPNSIPPVPLLNCVGRHQELAQLEQWALQDTTQIIWIWGLAGIGKSSVAASLAQRLHNCFELVIWHDLAYTAAATQDWISSVTKSSRTLILLDHADDPWNQTYSNSAFQGSTEAIQAWVRQFQSGSSRCCLIGVSREKPKWLRLSENISQTMRSLRLNGLGVDARSLLESKGLQPCPKWDELIALYQGHPLALNLVAVAIQDVFGGSVTDFLKQNTIFLGDLRPLLKQQIDRLSIAEHEILKSLASVPKSIGFSEVNQLMPSMQLQPHIIEGINSLIGRSLIETTCVQGEIRYDLHPLVRQYSVSERITSPDMSPNLS